MRSAVLDRIVRQLDPELLKAVEQLSKNETATGVGMLQEQGRVTEIPNAGQRIAAIAKVYSAQPESTIIVSLHQLQAVLDELYDALIHV